jgi:hypothetical protein
MNVFVCDDIKELTEETLALIGLSHLCHCHLCSDGSVAEWLDCCRLVNVNIALDIWGLTYLISGLWSYGM